MEAFPPPSMEASLYPVWSYPSSSRVRLLPQIHHSSFHCFSAEGPSASAQCSHPSVSHQALAGTMGPPSRTPPRQIQLGFSRSDQGSSNFLRSPLPTTLSSTNHEPKPISRPPRPAILPSLVDRLLPNHHLRPKVFSRDSISASPSGAPIVPFGSILTWLKPLL